MQARRQFSSMQARAGQVQRGLQEPLDRRSNLPQCCAMPAQNFAEMVRRLSIAALSLGLLAHGSDTRLRPAVSPRLAHLPRITVWAWERREDLRELDRRTTAVAYLDRTVLVDARGLEVLPRRQPMLLPAVDGLTRIAVVRIETRPGAPANDTAATAVAEAVVEAAGQPGLAALQVDFDARQSERAWYARVLRRVRSRMPPELPLSITALASWCSYDGSWLHMLPIDEVVPMLFRMEPDRRRIAERSGLRGVEAVADFTIREPQCLNSAGISTTEAWPRNLAGKRVYIFPDRGWARDGLAETVRSLP